MSKVFVLLYPFQNQIPMNLLLMTVMMMFLKNQSRKVKRVNQGKVNATCVVEISQTKENV